MATRRCGSEMRGYAPTISSYSGLESAVGYPGDLTGMMTFGLCDPVAGTWGLLCVLAALRERERTGEGRLLRLGQLEGFLALLGEQLEQADREGDTPPSGNVHPYFSPYGVYPAADGEHVAVAAQDEAQRDALAGMLGVRRGTPEALERSLREFVGRRPAREVAAALGATVACEPVLSYPQTREEPGLRDSGLLAPVEHPLVGRHLVYTQPWRIDGARPPVRRPAPVLGAHTAEVASEWLT
jgi:crotonobetainyl-CoA:carnitine CoA-transferase CaiB-like acyl-CoA transferase